MKTKLALAAMLAIVGCNNNHQSSDERSIRIELDEHLKNEQNLCLNTPSLPIGQLAEGSLISSKESKEILALHQIGLLNRASSNTPDSTTSTQYSLSKAALPYLRKVEIKTFGLQGAKTKTENRICYGVKKISQIIEKQPADISGQTTQVIISYTYKINNLAEWARENGILEAFPDIRKTIDNANNKEEQKILRRTSRGWTVIGN